MVRFQNADQGDVGALLESFGTVDRYLASVQEYLPYLKQPTTDEASHTGRRAHAVVMQEVGLRTPQFMSGDQLFSRVQATRLMPFGVDSLDALLGGGMRETTVTEIAGETCSGKTQLCYMAAIMTAQRSERVVYFDTTNSFSVARVKQLSEQSGLQALGNITMVCCHSIHALLSSLDELARVAAVSAPTTWPKLVIVDSVSAVLSPIVGASQHNQGHVLVTEAARLLRHLAEGLQCSVLVTNHVVGAGGGFAQGAGREDSSGAASSSNRPGAGGASLSYKPALGEQWRGAAHVRLQLSRAGGDIVVATLLTHPMQPPGAQAQFTVGTTLCSSA